MPNHTAVANVHHFMRNEPPEASDPMPQMRREITRLRLEVEHLRATDGEARRIIREEEALKMKEFLAAYIERVEQLRDSRDHWRREAERLSALIAQGHEETLKKPRWFASKGWRNLKKGLGLWPGAVLANGRAVEAHCLMLWAHAVTTVRPLGRALRKFGMTPAGNCFTAPRPRAR